MKRNISHPCAFTQSYDSVNFKYSETFSLAQVNLSKTGKSIISNLLIQGFYFKTLNAIDTPVSMILGVGNTDLSTYIKSKHSSPDYIVQVDDKTGVFDAYNPGVNDSKFNLSVSDLNELRPHKFAFYNIAEADYDSYSAMDIIKKMKLKNVFMVQGTTYNSDSVINIKETAKYLYIIPFIAGLKKTEIASSFRASFTLEEVT